MATETKNFPVQMATVFKRLSSGRKISLILLVSGLMAGCVFLMMWATQPEFSVLFSDLEPEDAGSILSNLKERKIPYKIQGNGRSVLVPHDKVHETRLELASQGLLQGSTVGFELFDNTKLGMTEFAQNVNYQRAMQGELARTINGFAEVESSRVHLVMQPKSLFLEDEKPATASVVIKLKPGKWLTQTQVDGIVHLVSSSIMGLGPENVTVVDHFGKVLSGTGDESGTKQAGAFQLEYRDKIEQNLESRITTILEKALGAGKAMVRVSCLVSFKKHEKTEELYYPDNQVVRSEQLYQSAADASRNDPSGTAGLDTKYTGADAGDKGNQTAFGKQDRTVNYEIGKVTSHIVEPFGTIQKVSVAVLVDGTYETVEGDKGEMSQKYVARAPEEMVKLENIVKSAINYEGKRGDQVSVVNLPFETSAIMNGTEAAQAESGWMDGIKKHAGPFVRYLILLVVAVLAYIMVIRPVVQWVTATDVSDAQLLQQLPKTVGELEREFGQGAGALPYGGNAAGLISGNSEKTIQLLRSWMSQAP